MDLDLRYGSRADDGKSRKEIIENPIAFTLTVY